MKIALVIASGVKQIVLTPENDEEKSILSQFVNKDVVEIKQGNFYGCQGGYHRFSTHQDPEESLILIVEDKKNEN